MKNAGGKIPVIVGATGHRDLREHDTDSLKTAVRSELESLQAKYPHSEIKLLIPRQNTEMSLTCDGHQVFNLLEGDEISVCQGKDRALFVENPRRRFIEVLRDKLAWAGGFNA